MYIDLCAADGPGRVDCDKRFISGDIIIAIQNGILVKLAYICENYSAYFIFGL